MALPKAIYAEAVEGLFFRALGPKMTPRAKARLKDAGLDLDRKLEHQYPLEKFRAFAEIARDELFPKASAADAHRQMGELLITGYGQTLFGRAVLSMLKLMGVERSMKRLDGNMRAVNNFTQTRFTPTGPNETEYWINELGIPPAFSLGLIRAGMLASGAETVEAEWLEDRADGYHFRIRWSEKRR